MSSVIKSMKYNYSNNEISPESIDVSDDDDFNFKVSINLLLFYN